MITFWVLAPIIVLAALGVLFAKKAVHAALLLAAVMIGLAILYLAQDAPFLFAVQIIVYTGAIMMLFLFVLMLVGVDSSDSLVETIRGHRFASLTIGLLFGLTLVIAVAQATFTVAEPSLLIIEKGNVPAIAEVLFTRYVFAFEITSALLITAAVGAMVLAHRERLEPKPTQADLARQRMADYAESGRHPGPLPSPGVYARSNSVDTPALLPDGSVAKPSVSKTLEIRGDIVAPPTAAEDGETDQGDSDEEGGQ